MLACHKEGTPIGTRLGVREKLFLIYSSLTLLLIAASFAFFYSYLSGRLQKQAIGSMEEQTRKASEQIDLFMSDLNHASFQIMYTPELKEIMSQAADSDDLDNYFTLHPEIGRSVKNYLSLYKSPGLSVSRISIYNDRGDYISLGGAPENNEAIRLYLQSEPLRDIYKRFTANDDIHYIGPHDDPYSDSTSSSTSVQQIVSFYRAFRNESDETFGLIEFQQTVSKFEETLGVPVSGETQFYLFDKDGQLAYSKLDSAPKLSLTLLQLLGNQPEGSSAFSTSGHLNQTDSIMTYRRSPSNQWTVVLAEPKKELLSSVQVIGKLVICLSLSFVVLSFIMNYMVAKHMTKNIRRTVEMIREVRLDHLSIGIGDSGDELIQIHRAFNSVFDRLKLSMELEVQARSRDLKARIDALESQVNPHFLYNVLAVIGSVGEQAGVDKVAELCGKLGGMFRYTLQHPDKDVTVGDEINYALLYLDLMKERFEDHFQYRLELDESALASKVPRLIFQPLIENCFRHAFVQCNPPWIIHLTLISTSEFLWLFEVKDWGDGFDPSVLEDLQRRMEANLKDNSFGMAESVSFRSREGVGLFNTFMRLQLTFQELAFYEIFSNKPNGTIIRIGVKQGVF